MNIINVEPVLNDEFRGQLSLSFSPDEINMLYGASQMARLQVWMDIVVNFIRLLGLSLEMMSFLPSNIFLFLGNF